MPPFVAYIIIRSAVAVLACFQGRSRYHYSDRLRRIDDREERSCCRG